MTKHEWLLRADEKLRPYMADATREYAESLYETYVEEEGTGVYLDDPEGAVAEDMTYWD